jgi:hypothetical protein
MFLVIAIIIIEITDSLITDSLCVYVVNAVRHISSVAANK